jgi:hypothetical protein
MGRRPAITVRWSKRENDWLYDWPLWHRPVRATVSFVQTILSRRPHQMVNGSWPLDIEGGLLSPETVTELRKRGVDVERIRITLPLVPESTDGGEDA